MMALMILSAVFVFIGTISGSPSDHRALLNFGAEVRRWMRSDSLPYGRKAA